MFPDRWSGDKIITEANAAYIEAAKNGFTKHQGQTLKKQVLDIKNIRDRHLKNTTP